MLRAKFGLTRSNQVTEMLRTSAPSCVVAAFLIIAITGCEKNRGEAVVLAKGHIDALVVALWRRCRAQAFYRRALPAAQAWREGLSGLADPAVPADARAVLEQARQVGYLVEQALRLRHGGIGDFVLHGARYSVKGFGSKSRIAWASTREPFGTQRLIEDRAGFRSETP